MKSIWIEIRKFIKSNMLRIILTSLMLGTVFAVLLLFLNKDSEGNQTGEDTQNKEATIAYIQYYSEREDGTPLTNLSVVREYFAREDLVKEWAEELDIPLENISFEGKLLLNDEKDTINETLDEETLENSDEDTVNINMYKAEYSHLFTLTADSPSESKSFEIVKFYFDLLENEEIPFYQDKNVYIFQEPKLMEGLIRVDETMDIEVEAPTSINMLSIIAAYVLSFILVLGLFILKTLFSNELVYSFSYLWDESHSFLLFSPNDNNFDELQQFLKYPSNKKVYLMETPLSDNYLSYFERIYPVKELTVFSSLSEADLNNPIDEIILLVSEGETKRKWYKEQQKLLSIYNESNVKIVQLNKN